MNKPDPAFSGELFQGIMLDYVMHLFFYSAADRKHGHGDALGYL